MSAPNYPEIPPEAFGGKRPPADELRFYRLIEEKYKSKDGIEDVKLACGHLMSYPASLPPSQEYAYCLTCLHAWTERSRQARENIAPGTTERVVKAMVDDMSLFLGKGPRNGEKCPGEGEAPLEPPAPRYPTAICPRCGFETYIGLRGPKAGKMLTHRLPPEAPNEKDQ